MVGIVSGNSQGLSATSLAALGQRGVLGNAAQGLSNERVYVNVATGNLVVQDQDEHVAGHGLQMDLLRTYNSQGKLNDDNADNWGIGIYRQQILLTGTASAPGSTLTRTDRDGSVSVYGWNATRGAYLSTDGAGAYDQIRIVGSEYVWTDGDTQRTERYDAATGRLSSTADAAGNAMTFQYDGSGNLSRTTNASGETTYCDYSGNNLTQIRTVSASGDTLTRVRYTYDTSNRLSTVTVDLSPEDNAVADAKTYKTTYTYYGTSTRIATIAQSDGTLLTFTHVQVGSDYKVASVKDGLNQLTSFSYNTTTRTTTVTDPSGQATVYSYDAQGQLTRIAAPTVGGVASSTSFSYDSDGDLTRVLDADGRFVDMEHDASGNQILQKDSAGNTITRTFDAFNQILTETRYLQPASGGNAPQAPLTVRYVYDASGKTQLRFVLSADGRVTEHRYNAYGERIATLQYASAAYSLAALTETAVPSEADVAAWAAQQNLTQVLRTDYAYDFRGQLQSVATYQRTDASGVGIADAGKSVTTYVYSQAGMLLSTLSGTGGSTLYAYDGLGRIIATTDASGQTTLTTYDDVGNRTIAVSANGLRTIRTYDKAGQLISVQQTNASAVSLGTTQYFYDANGRLRMSQDPTGARNWILYDEAGRKTADVDATGDLTEYLYNKSGQVTQTVRYFTAVNTATLVDATGKPTNVTLATIRPVANAADRKDWLAYDASGRLAKTVDSLGAVAENVYDGASRLVSVIRYVNRIVVTGLGSSPAVSAVAPVASAAADRVVRSLYDADGLLRGTLDAEGYLTELRYDAAGRLASSVRYATATDAAQRAAGALQDLRPQSSAQDITTYRLLDNKGQLAALVDGEGYLTEYVYDASGNATLTVRYANRVDPALLVGVASSTPVAQLRPASSASDQSASRQYDALNRVTSDTDYQGLRTEYVYDVSGNLVQTTRAAGTGEVRTILARYDLQGRLIGELSAVGVALITGGMTQAQIDTVWSQYGLTHAYDMAGRRTSTMDANGYKTLYFYDANGRSTHSVNALGEVVESQYNKFGDLAATVRYGSRISLTTLTGSNAGGLVNSALTTAINAVKNAALDSKTTFNYTTAGRVVSTVDALGNVSSFDYNAFGEEILRVLAGSSGQNLSITTAYDRRGFAVGGVRDPATLNAATSAVFDAFGRQVSTTDAMGGLRQQTYDRLGRVVVWTNTLGQSNTAAYDAFGRTVTQTDALGNTTGFAYSASERSVTLTTPEGVVVKTVYNRHGQVQTVTDGRGTLTSYSYDLDGRQVAETTPLTSTGRAYDRAGRLIQTTDANGVATSLTYDAANRVLTRTVDPGGLAITTQYAYDAKGQQISVTDPLGTVTQFTYDLEGRLLRQAVDPAGLNLVTAFSYDPQGRTLTTTNPVGTVTKYTYDAAGRRITEQVDPTGLNLTRRYTYDQNDNVVSATDPNGNISHYGYDTENRRTFAVDGSGYAQQTVYDAAGRIGKTVAYKLAISIAGLDDPFVSGPVGPGMAGRIQSRLSASATDVVEYRTYNGDGRLLATVSGEGDVTKFVYDANGNVLEVRRFANRVALSGAQAWVPGTPPAPTADDGRDQRVRTSYDVLNRAVYTVSGVGTLTQQVYDGNGNLLARTVFSQPISPGASVNESYLTSVAAGLQGSDKNVRTTYVYDRANRMTWAADAAGSVRRLFYDRNGNVYKVTQYATAITPGGDPQNVNTALSDTATDYVYDKANRQIYAINPLGGVVQTLYDKNGNVAQRIEHVKIVTPPVTSEFVVGPSLGNYTLAAIQTALGSGASSLVGTRITALAYDAADRLVLQVDPMGAVTENIYAGNTLRVRQYVNAISNAGITETGTLAAIRARIVANAASDREQYQLFDSSNRLALSIDAGGYATRHEYDALGHTVKTTQYDARATGTTVVVSPGSDRESTFRYDGAGRLVGSTDALGYTESYAYDAVGNKRTFTNKNGALWSYDYDAAGRLTRETSPPVELTAVAAAWGSELAVDGAHSGTGSVVTVLAYDAFGNLTSRTEASGRPEQRTTSYEYDGLGRQIKTIYPPTGVYNAAGDTLTSNGVGSLAARTETLTTLYTTTRYDAFGNAVASRDVAGSMSYKSYDKLGRVIYEVDALGGVTGYTRNIFGDTTTLVRYGALTSLAQAAPVSLTDTQVAAAVNAAGVDHSADRTILTEVDKMGRVLKVTEPATYVYTGSSYVQASKVTKNAFNAFGDLTRVSVLANPSSTWSAVNHYYDNRGLKIATVDALGYVSAWQFDAAGNTVKQTEYATKVASWDGNSAPAAVPTVSTSVGVDRIVQYAYDRGNRQVSQTRMQVQYSLNAGSTHQTGNLTTQYTYDAVGNLVLSQDAAGGRTYTYYDALGRVVAVVAPSVNTGVDIIAPLTVYQRDAHGKVVVELAYAKGAAGVVSELAIPLPVASDPADRRQLSTYDALGRVIQTTDANHVSHYTSYDAAGHWAKEWQGVSIDGATQTSWRTGQYDKLGRLSSLTEPGANTTSMADGLLVTTRYDYNAFGEVVSISLNGTLVEWYRYDKAGRVLATNAQDGEVKFYLYDVRGLQTSEIRSAGMGLGNEDLSRYTTAQQVMNLASVSRVDRVYDLNGRMTQEWQPNRQTFDNITNPWKRPVVYRTYDRWNNVVSVTDPRDASWITEFTYNASNQVTKQSHRMQGNGTQIVTEFYYDAVGRQAAVRDANNHVNTYVRDAAGNVVGEQHADSGIVSYRYSAFGDKLTVTDELGHRTTNSYDGLGHLLRVDKDAVVSWEYYDDTNPGNARTAIVTTVATYAYDQAGRRISETNGNNETTGYRLDMRGNVVETTLHGGQSTRYTYDDRGYKTAAKDANGNKNTWSYDYFGLLLGHTDLGGTTYSYNYDNARQLFSQTSTAGQNLRYAYDAAGQLVREYDWSGLNLQTLTWDPDFQGLTHLYDYDLAGNRIFEQTLSWGQAVQGTFMAYDSLGRLNNLSNVTGYTVGINVNGGFDPKAYMAFNPDVYAAWQQNANGLSQDEYAVWHYGKYGINDANRVTGVFTATTAAVRVSSIAQYISQQMAANRPYAIAAYMLLNRITLAQAASAAGMTTSALSSYFSTRSVPADAYTVVPTQPVPPAGFVIGGTAQTPEQLRQGTVANLWSYNYGNPRTVALGMLEYKITVEELAYAVDVDPSVVRQYFVAGGVDPSNYDITQQAARVDAARVQSLQSTINGYVTTNTTASAQSLADLMIQYRITPEEAAMIRGNVSTAQMRQFFTNRGFARDKYDIGYRALPSPLSTSSGFYVDPVSRPATVAALYQAQRNDLRGLAATMLSERITPEEIAAYNNYSVSLSTLTANFAAAGISDVNYDYRLMAETSQTRGIAYREVWAQLSSKPTVMINMAYDAVGNRKSIATTYANLSQTTSTRYFAYDEMNRQTVVDAVDASLNLGQVGHRVTYDKAGNRTSDTYWGDFGYQVNSNSPWQKGTGLKVEIYGYDAQNRLITTDTRGYDAGRASTDATGAAHEDSRQYDGAGRVVRSGSPDLPTGYYTTVYGSNGAGQPNAGLGFEQRYNRYDFNGHIQHQTVRWSQGTVKYDIKYQRYDTAIQQYVDGYDAAGNLLAYTLVGNQLDPGWQSYGIEYTYDYQERDSYQENTVSARVIKQTEAIARQLFGATGDWHDGGRTDATTTSSYDRSGHLIKVSEQAANNSSPKVRTFVNNADGVVLQAIASGKTQRQFVADGEVLGRYDATTSDFHFGYQAVGNTYPANTPVNWVVAEGDTLQSIARAVYGDPGQWYLVAEANGLGSSEDLQLGQILSIPSRVGGASNNDSTFKPYDPRDVVGDTTPTMPLAQGKHGGCGGLGAIITVIVAVAATIYTAGAAAGYLGAASTAAGATGTAAIGGAALSGGGLLAGAGGFALGSSAATVMASAAIGGAVGAIASQGVAMAMGMQDEFSWKGVALSAISAGVSSGLGTATNLGQAIARAAITNAATQGIGVVTGLQKSFDWRGVAASAVGAGVGYEVGGALKDTTFGLGQFGAQLARGTLSGVAAGTAAAVMRGGRVSIQQVASDAFGNVLGQSLAEAVMPKDPLGDFINDKLAEQNARDRYGLASGGPVRFGRSSGDAVADWSARVNQGIASNAAALRGDWTSNGVANGSTVYDDGSSPNAVSASAGSLLAANGIGMSVPRTGERLTLLPRELSALNDPAVRADPEALRRLYNVARDNSRAWLPTSLSPEETSLTTGVAYRQVFGEDSTAIWFGLAPYATSKVGETYQQLDKFGLLDRADTGIIRSGFREGNRAIFESMFTAEQFYQAGGTAAIRAMVDLDNKSFGANWTIENAAYANSLVESFELRDQAKSAFAAGQAGRGEEFLGQSLRASANFEQRVVLQQYYDQSYTAGGETKTLRQAVQGAFKLDTDSSASSKGLGWGSDPSFRLGEAGRDVYNSVVGWAAERASTVTINGKSLSFTGTDVGDVNQRMPFVYSLAGNLMNTYSSDGNWLSGSARIYQDQLNVMNKTYGPDAVSSIRQRLGFGR